MALDAAAAAAVATQIVSALGFTGPTATAQIVVYTTIVSKIFDGIKTNAIVDPAGIPPMSNGGGTVGGFGKVT